MELSERLKAVADWVPAGAAFADVGTDHAFLPVWLLLNGRIQGAVAADLRPGPLDSARRTAAQYGVTEQLSFRLCDGLTGIQPQEADVVAIAGMGGETIAAILNAAPWTKEPGKKLLLQPMTSLPDLRNFLQQNGYELLRERVVREDKRLYTVLEAAAGAMPPMTPGEQCGGRPDTWVAEPLRLNYIDALLEKLRKEQAGVERSSKPEDQRRRAFLRQAITELEQEKGAWKYANGF
ncbi:MAG: SAM-dependent methyltransferase [Oscillospiraceae bacterium]|nr:SAM-dependent methyltransferase [Oscillospiraceae bacterium]